MDALFVAIEENKSLVATHIIRAKGARLGNKKLEKQNRSPLHEAVRTNNRTIAKELLKHSECVRYIDLGDESGRSALHEAAARGYIEIIRDLLNNKANVDVSDNFNMTPFTPRHDFGAEINTKDKAGNTPLHEACIKGDVNMASSLLSYGADAGVRNADGKTPPNVIPEIYEDLEELEDRDGVETLEEKAERVEELRQLFKKPWGISERKSRAIVPGERPVCPERNKTACDNASVYVRHYWRGRTESWATSTSVSDLVYKETTLQDISEQFKTIIETRLPMTGEVGLTEEETWKWIHFSANNMTWIKDLIWLITHSKGYDPEERSRAWSFWDRTTNDREGKGAGSTRVPHAEDSWKEDRFRGNTVVRDASPSDASAVLDKSERKSKIYDKRRMKSGRKGFSNKDWRGAPSSTLAGFARSDDNPKLQNKKVPFIDFETEPYLKRRDMGKASGHLKKMLELFHLYSPYTGKDGLQIPKTLDESYYDMLSTDRITARDKDQVVYKWYQESNRQEDKSDDPFEYFLRYGALRALGDDTPMARRSEIPQSRTAAEQSSNPNELIRYNESNSSPESADIEQTEPPNAQPLPEKDKAPLEEIPVKYPNKSAATGEVAKLLMVHQLWLWKLGDNTVITCCPDRCHTGAEDTLIDTIRQGGIKSMHEPDDLIEHILYECATSLDKFCDAGLKAHVLDIFDNRIAKISDDEVVRFKQFSKHMEDAKERGKRSSSKDRSITDEIRLLYEVKDVRDELNLVRRVFEAQAGVLEKFSRLFWPGFQDQSKRCRESFLEDCGIKELIDRATRLDEDAKKTLEALDYLVQVKQAQTSLDEAEAARLLNNYIVLFTIVTIIFTPPSFITSLFSVPVKQFPHDGDNLSYEETWFTGRIFAGELITLAVILVIVVFQRKPWRNSKELVGPPREEYARLWRISEDYPISWPRMRRRRVTLHDLV
ncbi:hypothetical protein GGR51DRAFT_566344 [Nemania sp. FL0031]|nr:hypothetical protein GGR51DRAFT_566344 [Nemania sp. FL0031]